MGTTGIADEIRLYLRARVALIVLVTVEEQRALDVLDQVRRDRDPSSDLVTWDIADGMQSAAGRQLPEVKQGNPVDALTKIQELAQKEPRRRDLYVLKDFHAFWERDPAVRRRLRNLAHKLVFTGSSLIVTTPVRTLPVELGDDAVVVEMPLPEADALRRELDHLIDSTKGVKSTLTPAGRSRLAQAALGLTAAQARRAFAKAIVRDEVLDDRDIEAVLAEKKAVIRENEALEFYGAEESPDDLGGLDVLKEWLRLRERAFGDAAREFRLPAPKGIALIGIPGTGKSLTAKMIGGLWRLPLLRLDVGALFGSLVGESEERVRRALRLAETVSPCVLWIDEVEKALASGGHDGGTSQRVFGTVLTWMQEKTAPVFVVATANDVSALPPETLRRGRFDEVFFLDLPTEEERREIITVHLRKRGRKPEMFDVHQLARDCDGFVGAELEQVVVDAMYEAFAEERDITTDNVARAAARTVPLSRSQREVIEDLRAWLREGRAQSASFAGAAQAAEHQVPVLEV
ncbi:AAA family ATPase [Streptomyces sp. V4I2]|uniref:AAA family ATPase n=1 Tax=Streptomyces sp. V4I2 TaxID=3042280 RepID=UPI00278793E0|nr:AAA family ATPase [Streptomyces sp. V4I2]MDQ1042476.1 SpoVK/Ycf46/Vps4 family AAA+-type ATPase [Streptomyces sp. V4I2]